MGSGRVKTAPGPEGSRALRRPAIDPAVKASKPLLEVLAVYAGITAATAAITYLPRALPGLDGYVHLLIAGLFLVAAVQLARREPDGMRRMGIDLGGVLEPTDPDDERPAGPLGIFDLGRALGRALPSGLRELGVGLAVCAVVFPPFVVGFYFWHEPSHELALSLPEAPLELAATQLLVIALPEEAFFRGYVQTRLHDAFGPGPRVLGVQVEPRALLLQAALFAAIHFVSIPHPARLAVFFPALLFGVLRAWRGGIGAAVAVHAMSNLLAETLERGWL